MGSAAPLDVVLRLGPNVRRATCFPQVLPLKGDYLVPRHLRRTRGGVGARLARADRVLQDTWRLHPRPLEGLADGRRHLRLDTGRGTPVPYCVSRRLPSHPFPPAHAPTRARAHTRTLLAPFAPHPSRARHTALALRAQNFKAIPSARGAPLYYEAASMLIALQVMHCIW